MAKKPKIEEGYRPVPGQAWVLKKKLGAPESGFGDAWLAINEDMQSSAVFKFVKNMEVEKALALRNELDKLRNLSHPGIIRLEESGLQNDVPYLRYEYVEDSVDLSDALVESPDYIFCGLLDRYPDPLDVSRAILKVAKILAFCHTQDPPIVHRDLKPANILVIDHWLLSVAKSLGLEAGWGDLQYRVIDFGLATRARRDTQGTTHNQSLGREHDGAGTWPYCSPQQGDCDESYAPDPSDDIFSLGCIWWQMLTGRVPRFRQTRKTFESKLGDHVPTNIRSLLLKCVAEEREDRIKNAVELVKALEPLLPSNESLAAQIEDLDFEDGLKVDEVTPSLVSLLAKHTDTFNLTGIKSLPMEGMRQLITAISSRSGMLSLTFDDSATLLPECVTLLANYKGDAIRIDCLAISPDAAGSLAAYPGRLVVRWRRNMPTAVASQLAKTKAKVLCIDNAKELSSEAGAELARFSGQELILCGLDQLETPLASAIAQSRVQTMIISGEGVFQDELADWEEPDVSGGLGGIYLTPDTAAALTPYKGRLELVLWKDVAADVLAELGQSKTQLLKVRLAVGDTPATWTINRLRGDLGCGKSIADYCGEMLVLDNCEADDLEALWELLTNCSATVMIGGEEPFIEAWPLLWLKQCVRRHTKGRVIIYGREDYAAILRELRDKANSAYKALLRESSKAEKGTDFDAGNKVNIDERYSTSTFDTKDVLLQIMLDMTSRYPQGEGRTLMLDSVVDLSWAAAAWISSTGFDGVSMPKLRMDMLSLETAEKLAAFKGKINGKPAAEILLRFAQRAEQFQPIDFSDAPPLE